MPIKFQRHDKVSRDRKHNNLLLFHQLWWDPKTISYHSYHAFLKKRDKWYLMIRGWVFKFFLKFGILPPKRIHILDSASYVFGDLLIENAPPFPEFSNWNIGLKPESVIPLSHGIDPFCALRARVFFFVQNTQP